MEDNQTILDYSTAKDRDLVSYAKLGSAMAFSELYKRSYQPVVHYISSWLKQTLDSEDIAQEAFLKAHRYISRFRGDSSFATWVRSIARQLVARNHRNKPEFVPLNAATFVQEPKDVLQSIQKEKLLSLLDEFLKTLPPAQREVLLLHIQKGLPYAEISKKTGKKVQTLRKSCQRALRKGRSYYKKTIQKETKLQGNSR